jgi:antitoxin (DNA-binding transcriptional repressor) of toxin-antitoxin stability system
MIRAVTVTEVMRNFADYVNRVAYRGERFVLIRGGKPVAELAPVSTGARLGELTELLRSLPRLAEGDAVDFGADLDPARSESIGLPPGDRWES